MDKTIISVAVVGVGSYEGYESGCALYAKGDCRSSY